MSGQAGDPSDGLHADLVAMLTAYEDADAGQRAVREAMLAYLAVRPDALRRSCVPGHFTASTLVIDPSRDAVLLTLHPRIGRWLQLGGHFENDASIVDAALREAIEESGIPDLEIDPHVLNLDVHPVTCSLGVPTRHLDVRFAALAPPGAEPAISAESLDLRWFPRDRLPDPIGPDVPEQARRAFTTLAP